MIRIQKSEMGYDDVYAVVRLDNGAYHSDVCTVPSAATPVPITVQIFINGVRTDYGCSYDITDELGAKTTRFWMHETATVRIHDIHDGYTFDRMTLLYPGREEPTTSESDFFGNYVSKVLIDGIDPIVRIYLKAEKYPIRAYVYTVDADGFKYLDEVGGTVKIPSEAFFNETFEYTVTPYRGYFVKEISYDENSHVNSVDVKERYQSATYTDRMGSAGRTYVITMQKLPTYRLTLLADPEEGGTITAEIPKSAKLDAMVEGDRMILHAEPVEGWSLTGITYHLGTDGEEQELIADPEEGYVFTMPASDVVITAHFAAKHTITSEFLDISGTTPLPVSASAVYSVNGEPTEYFSGGEEVTATVSCAENLAVFSTEATPETALTQTDKYTFTFTMPDDDLQITYHFKKLAIKSAYLHLNEDINIIYTVQVPEGFTEPKAEFTFMGKSYTVTEYFVDEQGKYCFEFKQVTPQYMGEPIDITVSAAMGDHTYTHSTTGYSIRKYCQNMLGKSTDELLNTLLSDTLCYGAASQEFVSYKTDELVTDGIDNLEPSKYPGLSGLKPTFVGTEDPSVKWESVALRLSNNMCMDYTFYAASTKNLSVTITVDGRMQTFTTFEPVEGETNIYRICYRGIYASEFGATVSASFHRDGAKVGNTLKYCVNAYVCSKQDAGGTLEPLVKTIYNYGVSALTYYNERILKK